MKTTKKKKKKKQTNQPKTAKYVIPKWQITQSVGAVEYTDCIRVRPHPNECPDMTLNNLMARLQ